MFVNRVNGKSQVKRKTTMFNHVRFALTIVIGLCTSVTLPQKATPFSASP